MVNGRGSSALTTATRYDHDGNVFQVQQPNGDTVVNTYDLADQLAATLVFTAPISQKSQASGPQYDIHSYDNAGNPVTHTDADGRSSTTTYDGDSRVVQQVDVTTAPTGTTAITTTPSYDPDGNVVQQTMQTADTTTPGVVQTHTQSATYNAADWPTSSTDDGLGTSYSYDAAGQERTQTVLTGTALLTSTLGAAGRQTALSESVGGSGPYTSSFAYNPNDLPLTITLPGGVQETAQYDANSRLTSWHDPGPGQNVTYAYAYNAVGWVTSASAVSGTDTITHDAQAPQRERRARASAHAIASSGALAT